MIWVSRARSCFFFFFLKLYRLVYGYEICTLYIFPNDFFLIPCQPAEYDKVEATSFN